MIHPLVAHSADVAAVMAALLTPGGTILNRLAQVSGNPDRQDDLRRVLIYLAALHDLGKTNLSFQDQGSGDRDDHRRRGRSRGHVKVVLQSMMDHGPLGLALRDVLAPFGDDEEVVNSILWTTLCHHGRPWPNHLQQLTRQVLERLWNDDLATGRSPLTEVRRLGAYAVKWSGIDRVEEPHRLWGPQLSHVFAGLLMAADWIGSTERIFPPTPHADGDPDRYWAGATERAVGACRGIGILPTPLPAPPFGNALLERLFPKIFPGSHPTPLQQAAATMPLPAPGARLLIESETGSGKTEAVLTLFSRLRTGGVVDGLVFALPTRATSKAMHDRVSEAVDRMYPAEIRPAVVHATGGMGGSNRAEGRAGLSSSPKQYHDDGDAPLAYWATEHGKRFLAGEIVVGTIDQILLAGLPVRHAHLRLGLLTRHLIVVDEVHSHDRYMAVILANILDLHSRCGGTSVLLSATLSRTERSRYAGPGSDETGLEEAIKEPYPALSVLEPGKEAWIRTPGIVRTARGNPRRFSWDPCSEADGLNWAIQVARSGGHVCILRNTVGDAVATIRRLGTDHPELLWRPFPGLPSPALHSRYLPEDRRALDDAVLRDFGPDGRRPAQGSVVVSTQVVEQSLDVDFDLLVTDLAPIDVLIQRLGRVHRHPHRARPSTASFPRALVISPREGLAGLINVRHRPRGWGKVYRDLMDLELTLRTLRSIPEPRLPSESRLLIESVYHESRRAALEEEPEWSAYALQQEGVAAGQVSLARKSSFDFTLGYPESASRYLDDAERSVRTRLGDQSVTIQLPTPVPAVYAAGAASHHLVLPEWALRGVEWGSAAGEGPQAVEAAGEVGTFLVEDTLRVRYTDQGWVWDKD